MAGTSPCRTRMSTGLLVCAASLAVTAGNAVWHAPPRFDGAGYAVLASSLMEGTGYRAIDRADRRLHGHFPPGYPVVLASIWSLTGISVRAAHVVSVGCVVGATVVSWWWYRHLLASDTAFILGLALAMNWLWARTGSAVLSEPLYMLLCQVTVAVVSCCKHDRPSAGRAVVLGVLLAGCA